MGKKQKQQQNKASSNASTAKPKASKVIALKDMKETKTAPKKVVEEKKVEAKAPVVEKEKDLTKRETKDERKAGDRAGNRSGHGDAKGKKTNEVEVCQQNTQGGSIGYPNALKNPFCFNTYHTGRENRPGRGWCRRRR